MPLSWVENRALKPRPFRLCAYFLALALGVSFAAAARAESGRVVIVETKGPLEWSTVERRLVLELLEAGQSVVQVRAAQDISVGLSTFAPRFDADAVIQVARRDHQGILRLWLSDEWRLSGAYRHLLVDLRGADVVSAATLPAVELALNGWRELVRPYVPPPPRPPALTFFHDRSATRLTLRSLVGVLFPGGGAAPSANLLLGARIGLLPVLSFDAEAFAEPGSTAIGVGDSAVTLGVTGARSFVVLEPWPRLPISVGVGLGAGVARVEIAQRLAESSPTRVSYTPLLGARAQLAAAVLERADILFALSWSKALTDVPLARDGQHGAMLFTPSFDAMLGFDVHCF